MNRQSRTQQPFDDPETTPESEILVELDWSITTIGPPSQWPPSLQMAVALVVRAPVPMQVWWGENLIVVADNHARFPLPGVTNPALVGARASEAWPGIWDSIRSGVLSILAGGPGFTFGIAMPEAGCKTTLALCPIPDAGVGSLPGGVLVTSQLPTWNSEDTRAALLEANRAKDEFLAMLGHELRNPLAPIATALQLLEMRSGVEGARERAIIHRQVTHLTRLVDDLLDVSRITRGKLQIELHDLDLDGVIAKAIEMAGPLIDRRGHRVVLDLMTHGAAVRGDPTRLAQVFGNLLTNAAKYTSPQGTIEVATRVVGSTIEIHVRDDGMGIAPEILPNVFEPFSQERQTLDRSQGGLGLGLAIVKGLVTAHGGTVSAFSAGRYLGSEFTVTLPISDAAPEERTELTPELVLRTKRRVRLLVVDDNRDAAMLLADLLREQGHDVRMAFEGLDALRIARGFLPQIVFLDLGLPLVDGYEICRKIRAEAAFAGTKVVALTGYGNAEAMRRTKEAGFDAHLVKPVVLARLDALIASFAA